MNIKSIYNYLLSTDGVSQLDRYPFSLDPESVKVDGRSKRDILRFLVDLSREIRFYGLNNKPQGDWEIFFDRLLTAGDVINEDQIEALITESSDLPPHLALLFAFLHIFRWMQEDLNRLPLQRLNYYYEDLLQLGRRAPEPDKVHLLFGLAGGSQSHILKAGTRVDAGKTASGLSLKYALDHDLLVTRSVVTSLKSSFLDQNSAGQAIFYKAEDAREVTGEGGAAWRPFGTAQLKIAPESRTMEPVALGWAIASPNLFMAEGSRQINLMFDLKSLPGFTHPGLNLLTKLDVEVTSEEGWVKADKILKADLKPLLHIEDQDPENENEFTLNVSVLIREASPSLVAFDPSIHDGLYTTSWPVVRTLLKPDSFLYENLSRFRIEQATVEVDVKGVKSLILQNDQRVQPVDNPVLPFGSLPLIGSNFYIGSEEAFSKSVVAMNLHLEWEDPPEDLGEHYNNYGNTDIETQDFIFNIDLLSGKNWGVRLSSNRTLFNSADTSLVNSIVIPEATFTSRTAGSSFARKPNLSIPGLFQHKVSQGFIRMVLAGPTRADLGFQPTEAPFEAFGHKTFPVAYTKQAVALSKFPEGGPGTPPELPLRPYTPALKSVTLDYKARDIIRPSNPNGIDQYFVQDLFGVFEAGKNQTAPLLPSHPGNGALYIGLEQSNAPQSLSLLVQIEEGSASGRKSLHAGELSWSYLSGNIWRTIAARDIIEESTNAFQKPGLIRLNLGADATLNHSLMPGGLRWLRLSVAGEPDEAASVEDLLAQAARATLVIEESLDSDLLAYEEHLSSPLPPETVTGLTPRHPAIKNIAQPFPSFGGKVTESNRSFHRRVSERLRHKNRAVTVWDYERVVLESFPGIYKVKCLPHSDRDNQLAPGKIRLVVVPDWRMRLTGDPLQPRADHNLLDEIGRFLENNYTTPFSGIHVSNPFYETLLVDCKISFKVGYDPGFFSSLLDEEIKKFLSPWAYEEGRDIVFGGRIHASEILAFIEGRDYVDYVADFDLYHRHGGHFWEGIGEMEIGLDFIVADTPEPAIASSLTGEGGKTINIDFVIGEPVEVASATRPDTILVSNAIHRIAPLSDEVSGCRGVRNIGIGEMIIGIDFVPVS